MFSYCSITLKKKPKKPKTPYPFIPCNNSQRLSSEVTKAKSYN